MNNDSNPTPQDNQAHQPPQPHDPSKPVAYDTEGRPLYLHPQAAPAPPQPQQAPVPQMVYMARPMDPEQVHISDEAKRRHEESTRKYPSLNLSKGEYVISAVTRHPIGLLSIWLIVAVLALCFTAIGVLLFTGGDNSTASTLGDSEDLPALVAGSLGFLYVLLALGGVAATYIYEQNKFFLTNESVIQEIQTSLFDKHEQTVSLSNIEDASYKKSHIVESIFNYGSIRLSTEGDETTYRFDYVANPKKHIAVLNNAVEAFKNGRPVEG